MVKDGLYYGLGMFLAAAVLGYFFFWWLAIIPGVLGLFFLWFFRDPERNVPSEPGLIVSPADGKVTDVSTMQVNGEPRKRISIFLNVFNVHVNRTPIGGVVKQVQYHKGRFGNAMSAISSDANEQNIVTVEGEGQTLVFKQIAGLLARRIVFDKKIGDVLTRGERIGMIKFGSRVDILLHPDVRVLVKVGDHVAGGSTVIAQRGAKP